jgi:putative ABC transport system substrate-binding protein
VKRREFITLLGGAVAWPLAARGQQGGAMPRVGVLFGIAENDPEGRNRIDAFRQGLEKLGWIPGKNLRIESRWAGGDLDRQRAQAAELVRLKPDVPRYPWSRCNRRPPIFPSYSRRLPIQ